MALIEFLAELERLSATADYHEATALVVRAHDPVSGYTQVMGPISKDTVEAIELREQLERELTSDGAISTEVTIELLFPAPRGRK